MKSVQETYREYAPVETLRPYVACYWTSTAPARSSCHRVLPDGCIDIIFDLSEGRFSEGTIIGTMTRPLLFETNGSVHLVAVRFRPGGAVPLLRFSADEITDSQTALSNAWRAGHLAQRIREAADDERRVRLFESALLERLAGSAPLDGRVRAAVSLLQAPGGSVESVAAAVDVSRQHLTRLFRRHVGVAPKQFARVARMQRLRSRIKRVARPNWPSLALDVGYYDQAHMIGECRSLTGVTPSELAKR